MNDVSDEYPCSCIFVQLCLGVLQLKNIPLIYKERTQNIKINWAFPICFSTCYNPPRVDPFAIHIHNIKVGYNHIPSVEIQTMRMDLNINQVTSQGGEETSHFLMNYHVNDN